MTESGWKVGQVGEGGEGEKGWRGCRLKSLDFIQATGIHRRLL